jgi:hypothetical protein
MVQLVNTMDGCNGVLAPLGLAVPNTLNDSGEQLSQVYSAKSL